MISTVSSTKDLLEFKEDQLTEEKQDRQKSESPNDVVQSSEEGSAARELELTQEEWDSTVTIIPGQGVAAVRSEGPKQSELITFNEALQFFQTSNMQEQSKKIVPVIGRKGFAMLLRCLCGPPRLCGELVDERDLIFNIAACALDNAVPIHMRVLQTIYRQLTGDRFDCPRYGRHWEGIGFQGCDPATDLRGVGFWGLMNLLYMVTCPQTLPLARSIFRLSLHEIQNFPFVVMSINVTAIAMQVVREERLNRVCNNRRQVVAVVNEFYAGLFLHLYLRWKNEHKTISHSGFILKDVEAHARRKTKALLCELETYLRDSKTDSRESRNGSGDARSTPRLALDAADITDLYSVLPECDSGNGHALTSPVEDHKNLPAFSPNDNRAAVSHIISKTSTEGEEVFI